MKILSVLGVAIAFAPVSACVGSVALPHPVSFSCRGFSLVAEIFPPGSRNNPSDRPICYFYSVGYPGTTWKVDAKLLWKAQLVRVPRPQAGPYQTVVSMRGHLVTMNGGTGTYQEHSVAIYDPNGKLVKSHPFKSLRPLVERMAHLPMWGWHRSARYFFPRKAALFYILLPWGKAMEFDLKDGAFQHGDPKGFPELAALTGKGHVDEQAVIWATSLRFSSITDVLQARASVPNRGEGRASIAPEIQRLSRPDAKGSAKRLQHLRANLQAMAAIGEARLKPDRALEAAVAKVREAHPGGGKAMWEALAALTKPGMTVREMKVALPPATPASGGGAHEVVLWDGDHFRITYPLPGKFLR